MSEQPLKPKVKIPMGQRKSGLAVPADAVNECRHMEVFNRIKPQLSQYVCGDCDEKLLMVVMQFGLMTQEQFGQFQLAQVRQAAAAQRKQKTGLVTLDEVRREQQEKK